MAQMIGRAARRQSATGYADGVTSAGWTEKERKEKEKVTVVVMCQVRCDVQPIYNSARPPARQLLSSAMSCSFLRALLCSALALS